MSKWLASVQSKQEAVALLPCLPDILDMKQPATGALGALPVEQVAEIVEFVNGRCLTSATVGDLPMQADIIGPALEAMNQSGVDYLKIGLFADDSVEDCLHQLQPYLTAINTPVIAVLFADQQLNLSLVDLIKQVGFAGVMVDTAEKNGRSLRDHWSEARLEEFVTQARSQDLLCGLAGALRIEDIASLKPLSADYLGFRSALCPERQRNNELQPELAKEIQRQLQVPLDMVG